MHVVQSVLSLLLMQTLVDSPFQSLAGMEGLESHIFDQTLCSPLNYTEAPNLYSLLSHLEESK